MRGKANRKRPAAGRAGGQGERGRSLLLIAFPCRVDERKRNDDHDLMM